MLKRFMRRNKRQAPPDRPQAKGSSGPEATDSDGREAAQEDADRGTAENEPGRREESAASGAGASASEHTGEDGPAGDEAPEDDRGQGTQNGDASEERRQGQDRRDPSRGDGPAGARRRVNVEEPEANEGPELGDPKLLPHLRAFARRAEAVRESDPHALLERAVAGLHELGDLLGQPLSLEDVLPALLDGPWRLRSALEEEHIVVEAASGPAQRDHHRAVRARLRGGELVSGEHMVGEDMCGQDCCRRVFVGHSLTSSGGTSSDEKMSTSLRAYRMLPS